MISGLNREQKKAYPLDQDLESRIANYELAARMQVEALEGRRSIDRRAKPRRSSVRHRRQDCAVRSAAIA